MVHLSDLSWDKSGDEAVKDYEKGQMVKAKVLDVDVEKERVSLGIKQLAIRSDGQGRRPLPGRAQIVTVTVTEVNDGGIEVELADGLKSFIRRADLSRDRADQRPERFGKGDKVDAMVTNFDKGSPQDRAFHQGARNGGGEGSRRAIRFIGLRRLAGRHPGCRAQEAHQGH